MRLSFPGSSSLEMANVILIETSSDGVWSKVKVMCILSLGEEGIQNDVLQLSDCVNKSTKYIDPKVGTPINVYPRGYIVSQANTRL